MTKVAGFTRTRLNETGVAAVTALSETNGGASIDEIAGLVFREHPDAFTSEDQASRFVRRLVHQYG